MSTENNPEEDEDAQAGVDLTATAPTASMVSTPLDSVARTEDRSPITIYPFFEDDIFVILSATSLIDAHMEYEREDGARKVMEKYRNFLLDAANGRAEEQTFDMREMNAFVLNAFTCHSITNNKRQDEVERMREMLHAQQVEISRLKGREKDGEDACEMGVCEGGKKIWVEDLPKEKRCACKDKVAACMACWSKAWAKDGGRCPYCRAVVGGV
tara:strand:+ start:167 stop:805 length:639 start_codon:yes stop_codon:yes gene_type:complete